MLNDVINDHLLKIVFFGVLGMETRFNHKKEIIQTFSATTNALFINCSRFVK